MAKFSAAIYLFAIFAAFAYGVSSPLIAPQSAHNATSALSSENTFLFLVIAVGSSILSAAVVWFAVYYMRTRATQFTVLFRAFVFALPAFSLGIFTCLVLGRLGIVHPKAEAFFLICAIDWLCGGISGLVALRSNTH